MGEPLQQSAGQLFTEDASDDDGTKFIPQVPLFDGDGRRSKRVLV
jgi:hypothetical protein